VKSIYLAEAPEKSRLLDVVEKVKRYGAGMKINILRTDYSIRVGRSTCIIEIEASELTDIIES
jgi:hypothetical protein